MTLGPDLDVDPPFLDHSPPHWAARAVSTVLLALFVVVALAAALVKVPETVSGAFILVPERGADPVRAAREGTVAEVRGAEGQSVAKDATLFVIRSQSVGDRTAEMRGLELQSAGTQSRLASVRAENESLRRADDLESRRLTTRVASLERLVMVKRKQLATTRDMADRARRGQLSGVVGGWEADRLELDADQLVADVEALVSQRDEASAALATLHQQAATRDVRQREVVRSLEQEDEIAQMRLESMRRQPFVAEGDLVVRAPCAGSLVRMMVSTAGAVVQAGDALGEIACAGERLAVEMTLGQQDVSRVRAGQAAKLLYDAFPYQRFGVKVGRVRWVGPATAGRTPAVPGSEPVEVFRALIDGRDSAVTVHGEARPMLVGMRGVARVVTGRRTLISYAFEPIRALRENFADPSSADNSAAFAPVTRGGRAPREGRPAP